MKTLLISALLTLSAAAHAGPPGPVGYIVGSPIESLRIDTDGFATVYFDYSLIPVDFEPGACRQDDMSNALAFDAKTDTGKGIIAVLIGAKGADLRVTAFGTGRCMVINGKTVEMLHFARAS